MFIHVRDFYLTVKNTIAIKMDYKNIKTASLKYIIKSIIKKTALNI